MGRYSPGLKEAPRITVSCLRARRLCRFDAFRVFSGDLWWIWIQSDFFCDVKAKIH